MASKWIHEVAKGKSSFISMGSSQDFFAFNYVLQNVLNIVL